MAFINLNGFFDDIVTPNDPGNLSRHLADRSVEEVQRFVDQEVQRVADRFVGRPLDGEAIHAIHQQLYDTVQRLREQGITIDNPRVSLTDSLGRRTIIEATPPVRHRPTIRPDSSAEWVPIFAGEVEKVEEEPQQMEQVDRFKPMRKLDWGDE